MDVGQQPALNRIPSDEVALTIGRMHLEIMALNFELTRTSMLLAALQPTPAPAPPPVPEPPTPDVVLDSQTKPPQE